MITDYADLKAQVADHLDRTDLTTVIPTFIQMGEARLNRNLRLKQMETVDTSTVSTDSMATPSGFLETISLHLKDSSYSECRYVAAHLFVDLISDSTGMPEYYTVIGGNIQFNRTPDKAYTYRHQYLKALDIATDSTNWVLTNHPDAYLYCSLLEAERYLKNDARIQYWDGLAKAAIVELNLLADRTRDDSILYNELSHSSWDINYGS